MNEKKKPISELTDKQRLFCDEYMKDFNASEAARRAGYSQKNAHVSAAQLLRSTNVQAYLSEKRKVLAEKNDITLEMILEGYRKLAFFDSRKFYENGKVKSVDKLDDETAFALSGFEASTISTEFGAKISTNKIKMSDRNRALDSLCRVLGYNAPDKVPVNADGSPAKQSPLLSDDQFDKLLNLINK